jgi:predicted secreted acid phosphatase
MSSYWDNLVLERMAKAASSTREYHEYTLENGGVTYRISISKEGNKIDVLISCW